MKNDDRIISLSNLFSALLRKIIPILCITLVFTLLGFAYAFMKSQKNVSSASVQPQQNDLAEAETRFSIVSHAYDTADKELQFYEEGQLSSLWDRISLINQSKAQMLEYYDASPVLSLNPYDCTVSDVSLLVLDSSSVSNIDRGDSASKTGDQAAAAIYSICTLDTSVLEKTRQILGIDEDLYRVHQLISVYNDNGVVHIRVYSNDAEAAGKAVDYLVSTVFERLRDSDAAFSIKEICRYSGNIIDSKLKERQITFSNEVSQTFKQLTEAENALSGLSAEMDKIRSASNELTAKYNSAKQNLETIQRNLNQPEIIGRSGKLSLRTIALAFFLGFFVACFGVICYEFFSVRLNSQSELLNRYSFPLLGLLPTKKKRLFDKTIRRLEGESASDFDTVARATAEGLISISAKHSACFVSSLGKETASTLVPYLDGRIGVCGDILSDPDAVKALEGFDSIVLIEQRGRSDLSQIDSEVLRANAFGKEILGIVLI